MEQKEQTNENKVSDSCLFRRRGTRTSRLAFAWSSDEVTVSALTGRSLVFVCFSHAQRKSSSTRKRLLQLQGRVQGHAHAENLLPRDSCQVTEAGREHARMCVRAHGINSESVCVFRRTKRSRMSHVQARQQISPPPSSRERSYEAE